MSIAIASSPPKPMATANTPAANTAGASTGEEAPQVPDFASLLLAAPLTMHNRGPEATQSNEADSDTATPAADPTAYGGASLVWTSFESPLPANATSAVAATAPTLGDLRTTPSSVAAMLDAHWAATQNGREDFVAAAGNAADTSWPTPTDVQRLAAGASDRAASFAVDLAGRQDESHALRAGDSEATVNDPRLVVSSAQSAGDTAGTKPANGDLPTPLHHPSWTSDFGQKLLWFANNDRQTAHMTLNPPEMGSLEITMSLHKDTASTHFVSANAEVRNALETALPRLREMFSGAGLELGQVTIGSETSRQSAHDHPPPRQPRVLPDNAILGIDSAAHRPSPFSAMRTGSALVDTFA